MELYQLQSFRVLCKHGNFTSASEELNVSQPAISMAIKKLENELGITLIDRHARGFVLTQAGEIVLKRAIAVHNEITGMYHDLDINYCKNQEVVRLAISITSGVETFSRLLSEFTVNNVEIALEIYGKGNAAIAECLGNRTVDVGIMSKDMRNKLLDFLPYQSLEIYAAFSPDHPFVQAEKITPKMLAGENLLFSKTVDRVPGYVKEYFAENGIRPHCTYCNAIPIACTRLATAGKGIALAPKHAAGTYSRPLDPPLFCDMIIAWNKKETLTNEMQTLIDYLSEEAG